MSNAARSGYVIIVLLALLGTLVFVRVVAGGAPGDDSPAGTGTGGAELAKQSVRFDISGDIRRPLSPGLMVPLNLMLTNPHDYRLRVSNLEIAVRKISAPRADAAHPCTRQDFAVKQVSGDREVSLAANTSRSLRSFFVFRRAALPQVGMIDRRVNQNGCKGASLTLAYTGSGTLVHR